MSQFFPSFRCWRERTWKTKNPATCEVRSEILFLNAIKCSSDGNSQADCLNTREVQWTKGKRGNGAGRLKKARQLTTACFCSYIRITRTVQVGNFRALLHAIPTLHQVTIICFSASKHFWLTGVWGVTTRQITLCRSSWRWPLSTKTYKRCSKCMFVAVIYYVSKWEVVV
jgi:hypothetical protein